MKNILKNQGWHIISLIVLCFFANYIYSIQEVNNNEFASLNTYQWFWISIVVPLIHQIYVTVSWRLELYNKSISRLIGKNAFLYYAIGFYILLVSRIFPYIFLAICDKQSLEIAKTFYLSLALIFLIPSAYTIYCIRKYFTLERAAGMDHFEPEICKNKELVKKGIFKYSSNAMYKYGFLISYVPGFYFASKAALISAFFAHIFIWIHYYCTEKPDLEYIYKK